MRYLWMVLLLTACVDDVEFDGFLYPCSGGLCVEEGPRAPESEDPENNEPEADAGDSDCDHDPEDEGDDEDSEEPGDEDSEEPGDDDDSFSRDSCNPPHGNAHGWGKWKGNGPC